MEHTWLYFALGEVYYGLIFVSQRRRKRRQRIRHIAVTTDGEVTYKDYTITVRRGGTVTNVIHGIRVLQTFRKPDQYLSFYGSSDETFPGTGKTTVILSTLDLL